MVGTSENIGNYKQRTVRIRLVKLTEEQYGNVWITNLITDAPVPRDAIS